MRLCTVTTGQTKPAAVSLATASATPGIKVSSSSRSCFRGSTRVPFKSRNTPRRLISLLSDGQSRRASGAYHAVVMAAHAPQQDSNDQSPTRVGPGPLGRITPKPWEWMRKRPGSPVRGSSQRTAQFGPKARFRWRGLILAPMKGTQPRKKLRRHPPRFQRNFLHVLNRLPPHPAAARTPSCFNGG